MTDERKGVEEKGKKGKRQKVRQEEREGEREKGREEGISSITLFHFKYSLCYTQDVSRTIDIYFLIQQLRV